LLNDLRTGDLAVDDERRARMEVLLGVHGGDVRSRLGLDPAAPAGEVRAALLGQVADWQAMGDSPLAGPALRRAAAVLRRTCEGLFVDAELAAAPADGRS
jgi:hypothetical protein